MKSQIVAAIRETLRSEFDARQSISKRTRAAGNDAESKAESKYDTLSIEENYLADGLAKQAHAAAQAAAAYDDLVLRPFEAGEPIALGALVELKFAHGREWFFLGPAGGGIEVALPNRTITVITPDSPLGGKLIGAIVGATFTTPNAAVCAVE